VHVTVFHVDALADRPFAANPTVCLPSYPLADGQLQALACEMNLPATAFRPITASFVSAGSPQPPGSPSAVTVPCPVPRPTRPRDGHIPMRLDAHTVRIAGQAVTTMPRPIGSLRGNSGAPRRRMRLDPSMLRQSLDILHVDERRVAVRLIPRVGDRDQLPLQGANCLEVRNGEDREPDALDAVPCEGDRPLQAHRAVPE
jgi:hypothetical protein